MLSGRRDILRSGLALAISAGSLPAFSQEKARTAVQTASDNDGPVFYGGFDMSRGPNAQGAALRTEDILAAIGMLGGVPIFCARYFSGVEHGRTLCTPADIRILGNYGIRLLPVARQTNHLDDLTAAAQIQAGRNVDEYLDTLHLARPKLLPFIGASQQKGDLQPIRFYLDAEAHHFTIDYYMAWATEILNAHNRPKNVNRVRFSSAIYMNVRDAIPNNQRPTEYGTILSQIKVYHPELCDGIWWARYPVPSKHNLINCRPLFHDLDKPFLDVIRNAAFPRTLIMQYAENCAGMDLSRIHGAPKMQFDTFSPTWPSLEAPGDVLSMYGTSRNLHQEQSS